VVLTSLFGPMQQLDKHMWSCAKEGLFVCFVQQCPQRVVLAAIFSTHKGPFSFISRLADNGGIFFAIIKTFFACNYFGS
jgi:hypothetical protein